MRLDTTLQRRYAKGDWSRLFGVAMSAPQITPAGTWCSINDRVVRGTKTGVGADDLPPTETTMSTRHLPGELLDHVVDHLCDAKYALMDCGLVSKSLISCSQRYLFANITFDTAENLLS